MQPMESTGLDPAVHRVPAQTHCWQLVASYDTVLSGGERSYGPLSHVAGLRKPTLACRGALNVGLTAYIAVNPTLGFGAPVESGVCGRLPQ